MGGMRPKAVVVKADGTNCEVETAHAVRLAGGEAEIVPMNVLRQGDRRLADYDLLVLPGGFSYGDDVSSGKILAVELMTFLADELGAFVAAGRPVVGICNGFQVLVRTGLLPFGTLGAPSATLGQNASGRYECRWVNLCVEARSPIADGLGDSLYLPLAHGEGRLHAPADTLRRVEAEGLVALRYTDGAGNPTQSYPDNPNGASHAIAGLTDPTGRIFGLMPHPERYTSPIQHPDRSQAPHGEADGLRLWRRILALV